MTPDTGFQFDAEQYNTGFIERLNSGQEKEAAAQALNFIRDRLRENCFSDMILPPRRVQRAELERSVNHDTLVYIDEVEPGSRAMSLTFRGQPSATYVSGKRYAISFWTISSLKFEIIEQELAAYRMPITRIIEENSIKDMLEVKDREFLSHVDACVEAMQSEGNGGAVAFTGSAVDAGTVVGVSKLKGLLAVQRGAGGTDDFLPLAIQKVDVIEIKRLLKREIFDSNGVRVRKARLRPSVMLATEADTDNFDQWTTEDKGEQLQSKTTIEGYGYDQSVGLRIIRTIKNDILREGNVYVFTEADFFGRNFIYNDIKFYVDKIANRIFWQAWMDIGMGFGNIASVVKLELYSGSVTPTAETSGYARAVPVDEESIGAVNNFVAQGLTFPKVVIY